MRLLMTLTLACALGLFGCSSDDGSSGTTDGTASDTTTTGGDTGGDTTGGDTTGGTTGEDGIDWDAMSFQEKQGHMASAVTPAMKELFQAHDSEAFANFTCATCHVQNMGAGTFEMPDPGLPQLDPTDFPDPESDDPKEAADTQFMMMSVLPQMAELLNLPPFDPATGQGFSCFSCHTSK